MFIKKSVGKSFYIIGNPYLFGIRANCFSDKARETLSRITEKEDKLDGLDKAKKYTSIYMNDVDAIVTRRRLQREYIEDIKKKKAELPAVHDSYGDIDVSMEFFMEHDDYESQLTDAILNYYEVSYKRHQNIVYLTNFMTIYGYKLEKKEFPVLRVYFPFEPMKYYQGCNQIVKFLTDVNFIFDAKHLTGSGYALQGVEFAKETLTKNLNTLFLGPVLTFENTFKSAPESHRQSGKSFILLRVMRLNFQKIIKRVIKNFFKSWGNRTEYKQAKKKVVENLEEWKDRLAGKDFHGGSEPDEADFAVYAALKCKYNSGSFVRFLEREAPTKVYSWFIRMQIKCKHDPDRFVIME